MEVPFWHIQTLVGLKSATGDRQAGCRGANSNSEFSRSCRHDNDSHWSELHASLEDEVAINAGYSTHDMDTREPSHPFQSIEAVEKSPSEGSEGRDYILAACGPKLVLFHTTSGEVVSQWVAHSSTGVPRGSADANESEGENQERPAKKQKVSSDAETSPNIIRITIAPDQQHAVVVTDDKCLHVFEISHSGELLELSQRPMPKRPCAIQVLPDNATILCGDKFGDVYSLPLIPQDAEPSPHRANRPQESKQQSSAFKPSASSLTVHTKRNLKSLEAQLKQKNLTPKTREPLKFKHKLLLGHVSMLTDLCYAVQEVDGKQRGHIITADRDEHIRVSRGPPQTHIIEGYCLGHTEFVSKILVIPGTNLMISGGGDDWLGVWEWPSLKLRRKIHDFRERVREAEVLPDKLSSDPIAVSGMWMVPGMINDRKCMLGKEDFVAVACEKSPVISFFPVSELSRPSSEERISWGTKNMEQPVLDITSIRGNVLVTGHQRERRLPHLVIFRVEVTGDKDYAFDYHEPGIDLGHLKRSFEKVASTVPVKESLDGLLYTVESLRKRTSKDREDGAEE